MEAFPEDKKTLTVGKYHFKKEAFEKAVEIIQKGLLHPGWIVIDEIGPLELKGEGFYSILNEALDSKTSGLKILLVIRKAVLDRVLDYFRLREAFPILQISEAVPEDQPG